MRSLLTRSLVSCCVIVAPLLTHAQDATRQPLDLKALESLSTKDAQAILDALQRSPDAAKLTADPTNGCRGLPAETQRKKGCAAYYDKDGLLWFWPEYDAGHPGK